LPRWCGARLTTRTTRRRNASFGWSNARRTARGSGRLGPGGRHGRARLDSQRLRMHRHGGITMSVLSRWRWRRGRLAVRWWCVCTAPNLNGYFITPRRPRPSLLSSPQAHPTGKVGRDLYTPPATASPSGFVVSPRTPPPASPASSGRTSCSTATVTGRSLFSLQTDRTS
jgi:hypothetical protein